MNSGLFRSLCCLPALFVCWAGFVAAQSNTAAIIGIVRTNPPQTVPGFSVQLTSHTTDEVSKRAVDGSGVFSFLSVPPDTYSLDVSLDGWKTLHLPSLQLRAAETTDVIVNLVPAESSVETFAEVSRRGNWFGNQFEDLALHELPNTLRIRYILENQEPSTVTDTLDIGGLETGVHARFGALGASWTENIYLLNGFQITDPYLPGQSLFDPSLSSLGVVDVIAAMKPASFDSSGVIVSMNTPDPAKDYYGALQVFFSNHALQSDNLNSRLTNLGFAGPERVKQLFDGSFHLTGKLPGAGWPFFVSAFTGQLSKTLGGFPATIDGHANNFVGNFIPFSDPITQRELSLFFAAHQMFISHANADPRTEPSATTRDSINSQVMQIEWRRSKELAIPFQIGFGFVHATLDSLPQTSPAARSTLEFPEKELSGAPPFFFNGSRLRYELNAAAQMLSGSDAHHLVIGAHYDYNSIGNDWTSFDGLQQVLVDGKGAEVILRNTPTTTQEHIHNFALFVDDSWKANSWLRFPVGLRMDLSSGSAQGASRGIHWTTLEPRAGIHVSHHGLSLMGSWSRYAHLLQGRYLDFGNPSALSEQTFAWNDINSNQKAEPDEMGQLLTRSGGSFSAIDSNLRRPYTDEIAFALQQDFKSGLRAAIHLFRRQDYRLIRFINTGVPFSNYSTLPVLDPGNDGIPGTRDDANIIVFDRNPSSLGDDFLVLANSAGSDSTCNELQLDLARNWNEQFILKFSFVAMKTSAPTNPGNSVFENDTGVIGTLGTDPDTLLLAKGVTFFDRGYIGKLSAYFRGPYRSQIGVVAKYYDGLPFARMLFVKGLNQGPIFIRATPRDSYPDGFRALYNATLDLRIARDFIFRRNHLILGLDVFNLLNMNNNVAENDLTGPSFEKRIPLTVEAPRIVRLSLELRF